MFTTTMSAERTSSSDPAFHRSGARKGWTTNTFQSGCAILTIEEPSTTTGSPRSDCRTVVHAAAACARLAMTHTTRAAPAAASRSVSVPAWRRTSGSSTNRNGSSMSQTTHVVPRGQRLKMSSVVVNLMATAERSGKASTRLTAAAVLPARLHAPDTVTIIRPS
jgi:hypothetical protein